MRLGGPQSQSERSGEEEKSFHCTCRESSHGEYFKNRNKIYTTYKVVTFNTGNKFLPGVLQIFYALSQTHLHFVKIISLMLV
jgi:hypothetical protein